MSSIKIFTFGPIVAVVMLLMAGCGAATVANNQPPTSVSAPPAEAPPPPMGERVEWDTFAARYDALDAPYQKLIAHLNAADFDNPEWRIETVRLTQKWRETINALREMKQPHGERWTAAWPVLMRAMDAFAYAAGAIENAAAMNEPMLMEPARERLIDGANLTGEAMRLLDGR